MADMVLAVVVVSALATGCFVVWTISDTIRRIRRDRLRYDTQSKLLERFGTSEELLAYLKSDPGQQFLESAELERTNPYSRILRAFTAGILLVSVGWAFLALRGPGAGSANSEVVVVGTLLTSLGVGFLLSGGLSYFLSRSWGLLQRHGPESQE